MMCYKDKTFCKFYEKCEQGFNCGLALTDKVLTDADNWWNKDNSGIHQPAPISVFLDKPNCYKEIKDVK